MPRDVIDTLIAEAYAEGPEGMRRVAETIINRAAIRGMSPEEVVRQPWQYTGFQSPGPAAVKAQQSAKARAAAEAAWNLALQEGDPTGGADHYFNPSIVSPSWAKSMQPRGDYGGHRFYSSRPIPPGSLPEVATRLDTGRPAPKLATQSAALSAVRSGAPPPLPKARPLQAPRIVATIPTKGAAAPVPRPAGDALIARTRAAISKSAPYPTAATTRLPPLPASQAVAMPRPRPLQPPRVVAVIPTTSKPSAKPTSGVTNVGAAPTARAFQEMFGPFTAPKNMTARLPQGSPYLGATMSPQMVAALENPGLPRTMVAKAPVPLMRPKVAPIPMPRPATQVATALSVKPPVVAPMPAPLSMRPRLTPAPPPLEVLVQGSNTIMPGRSGGTMAAAPAVFAGTSSGNAYAAGQTYQNGNGTFRANADGSFTDVRTGKRLPGSSRSASSSGRVSSPAQSIAG